jgi:hypothetical protein
MDELPGTIPKGLAPRRSSCRYHRLLASVVVGAVGRGHRDKHHSQPKRE